jgi:hypothetical protein
MHWSVVLSCESLHIRHKTVLWLGFILEGLQW